MNTISIKFDENLFSTPCNLKKDILAGSKIGFYKKGETFVFSTTSKTKHTLVTNINKISQVLKEYSCSATTLNDYDVQKICKVMDYLEEVHKIIGKRNDKLEGIRNKKIIKIFLAIPLINFFVRWYLQNSVFSLTLPKLLLFKATKFVYHESCIKISNTIQETLNKIGHFNVIKDECKHLKKLKKINNLQNGKIDLIEKYFSGTTYASLRTQRDKLLDLIKEMRGGYNLTHVEFSKDWEEAQLWESAEKQVIEAFYKRLYNVVPSLKIAEQVINANIEKPTEIVKEVLNLTVQNALAEGNKSFTDLKKVLVSDSEFPAALNEKINQAEGIVKKAYGTWFIQKAQFLDQKEIVDKYFNGDYKKNEAEKNEMFKLIDEASELLTSLHKKTEELEILNQFKGRVQADFDRRIREIYPTIVEAEKIIELYEEDEDVNILNLKDDDSLEKAQEASKEISISADLPQDLIDTIKEANDYKKTAYIKWHVNRLNRLTRADTINFRKILGVENRDQFLDKYKKLIELLKERIENPEVLRCIKDFTNCYEMELRYLLEPFIRLKQNPPADIGLNRNPPAEIRLRDVFRNGLTYQELDERIKKYQSAFLEWDKFERVKFSEEELIEFKAFSPLFNEALTKNIQKELSQRIPEYAQAIDIIETFSAKKPHQKGILLLEAPQDALAISKTSLWYKNKLNILEEGILNLTDPTIPKEVLDAINAAQKILRTNYAKMETTKLAERKALLKKPKPVQKGFFASLKSWFNQTSDAKSFLNSYSKDLKKLLGLNSNVTSKAAIDIKYNELCDVLKNSPAVEDGTTDTQRMELVQAYEHYERALKLEPLLSIAFNKKASAITLDSCVPVNSTLVEKQAWIESTIQLLDAEFEIQSGREAGKVKDLILSTLKATREHIKTCGEQLLVKIYPAYTKVKNILKAIPNPLKDKIYYGILSIHLSPKRFDDPIAVLKTYEKMRDDLKFGDRDTFPVSLQEDIAEAEKWILIAYKEWEADRIISFKDQSNDLQTLKLKKESEGLTNSELAFVKQYKAKILGVSENASKGEKVKRFRNLQMLIHTDRNNDLDKLFLDKILEASKIITPELYAD